MITCIIPMNGKAIAVNANICSPSAITSGSAMNARINDPRKKNTKTLATSRIAVDAPIPSQAARSARSGFSAPRFWPTIAAVACPRPIAGISARETILLPIPNALTAAVPNRARIPVITEKPTAVPVMPSEAGAPIATIFFTVSHRSRRWRRRMCIPSRPENMRYSPTTERSPREITVATAAPATSQAGNGPQPKMSNGLSTILIATAAPIIFIGVTVSPTPFSKALITNMEKRVGMPA